MTELTVTSQQQLLSTLIPLLETQFNKPVERIETHISILLLVDETVFKIKKPVDFGFLNFTELHQRKLYCEEELRLNRRLAPDIYQQVVSITGNIDQPQINGSGEAFEFMVQMKRFDQQQLFDQKLKDNTLTETHIIELSRVIADFHQNIEIADAERFSSNVDDICHATLQNFDQLRDFIQTLDDDEKQQFSDLEHWSLEQNRQLNKAFEKRLKEGFVRECHGDMHLGNITLYEDKVTIFDGIEFNREFRWIDVMSEIAFITMDLESAGQASLANILLNNYLELTGDYQGLLLLRYYQVYRAMVRAKVTSLRLGQLDPADPLDSSGTSNPINKEYQQQLQTLKHYLEIACQYSKKKQPALVITHGVSGSGKSFASQQVLAHYPFIRIRSDVERIRLFPSSQQRDSSKATHTTYASLHEMAGTLLKAGFSVILDATYLEYNFRRDALSVAAQGQYPFIIISLQFPVETLEKHISERIETGKDASEATVEVLHMQLAKQEPLTDEEQQYALVISDYNDILERITAKLESPK